MATNTKLGIDPSIQLVNIPLYRSMISCLLYLTASHPDISFSVGVCFYVGTNLVACMSKKQNSISLSTAEA